MFAPPTDQIPNVITLLSELSDDSSIPKNVKAKLQSVIKILNEKCDDASVKANKALVELDDINEDTNIQQYTRTQIWNVVSMLSKIN
jgi:uncharacterized protein (UPF0147 family)